MGRRRVGTGPGGPLAGDRKWHELSAKSRNSKPDTCVEENEIGVSLDRPPAKESETPAADLPPEWQTAIDSQSGDTYFWNTVTNEVRWTDPRSTNLTDSAGGVTSCVEDRDATRSTTVVTTAAVKSDDAVKCVENGNSGALTNNDDGRRLVLEYWATRAQCLFVRLLQQRQHNASLRQQSQDNDSSTAARLAKSTGDGTPSGQSGTVGHDSPQPDRAPVERFLFTCKLPELSTVTVCVRNTARWRCHEMSTEELLASLQQRIPATPEALRAVERKLGVAEIPTNSSKWHSLAKAPVLISKRKANHKSNQDVPLDQHIEEVIKFEECVAVFQVQVLNELLKHQAGLSADHDREQSTPTRAKLENVSRILALVAKWRIGTVNGPNQGFVTRAKLLRKLQALLVEDSCDPSKVRVTTHLHVERRTPRSNSQWGALASTVLLKSTKLVKKRKRSKWRRILDPATGKHYFFDPQHNVTQWEEPPQFREQSGETPVIDDEAATANTVPTTSAPAVALRKSPDLTAALRPFWIATQDPKLGKHRSENLVSLEATPWISNQLNQQRELDTSGKSRSTNSTAVPQLPKFLLQRESAASRSLVVKVPTTTAWSFKVRLWRLVSDSFGRRSVLFEIARLFMQKIGKLVIGCGSRQVNLPLEVIASIAFS